MQCAIMQDAVDGIVAAVEDKIILKSDVILNMQLSGVPLSQNSYTLERMYNDFLNQMIDDKVLLVAAEQDTNIAVDNNMVDARLDEYMKNIITEVGSEEQLIQAFNKSIREIKYYYRTQIYDAMLREMYIYNHVGDLDVSRKEIELFYNTYKDSLPVVPAKYNFSIIEVPIDASIEENERVKNIQKNLLEQINNGASFDQLAKDFSEDPGTRLNGGDQGYYQRGTLFPEFEDIAFNLAINEVSSPIKTPIGYHLIKLIDKQKDQIHTKHILHLVNTSVDDEIRVFQDLTQISNQTENDPGMFDSLATVYSKKFNNNSGVYTDIDETQMPNYIKKILNNSNEYTLNKPSYNEDKSKCSIIYAYNIQQQSTLNIEKNWDELEVYTKNKKQTDLLIKLIDKLKHKTFIKYYN